MKSSLITLRKKSNAQIIFDLEIFLKIEALRLAQHSV